MAFLVEDGTGLSGSNAYITTAEFAAYHTDRSNLYMATDDQIKSAIVRASDYIDQVWRFIGCRDKDTQGLEWPRVDAYYPSGDTIVGVPVEVKEACAEYAYRSLTSKLSPDPVYESSGGYLVSKTTKVGPVATSKTFGRDGSQKTFRSYPTADSKIRDLVINGRILKKV